MLIGADWTWQPTPIDNPWELNVTSFPGSVGPQTEIEDGFTSAMDTWTVQGASPIFSYTYGGTTTQYSWVYDGDMIAEYNATGPGSALAVNQSIIVGNNILECDIRVYGSNGLGTIDWNTDPAGPAWNEIDYERVLVHELGHCLGLDHSGSGAAIMYFATSPGNGIRDLNPDDVSGFQAIYGWAGAPLTCS